MIELIDVLTPDGDLTGVRKPKDEIHRHGHWHRAAHVWIITPDGRLLLQRRSLRKENNPGLWDVSAAGHLSAGESAIDAAVREVREELGLAIDRRDLHFLTTLRESCVLNEGTYIDHEFHDIYTVRRAVDLRALTLQPEEVDEVALVAPDALRARTDLVPHREEYELIGCVILSRADGEGSRPTPS